MSPTPSGRFPTIDPLRIVRTRFRDDQVPEPIEEVVEAGVEADLGGDARRRDGIVHLAYDRERRCERLLAEQRLAGVEGREHQVAVR